MNNPKRLLRAALFASIAVVVPGMAQDPQSAAPSIAAIPAELIEQKAVRIVDAIQSGDTATALADLNELAQQPEALTSLRGKDIVTRLYNALAASSNEAEAVCLGSVLIQTGDPNLADEMVLLAKSEDVLKKTLAAHFLLESGGDAQDVLHAYDVLAEVAQIIPQIPRTNLSPERSTHIANIARDTIKKFDRLRINAGLVPLRDALNTADPGGIPADEFRIKQLELIPPWWQANRLDVFESLKAIK